MLHPPVERASILWAVLLGSLISAPFLPLLSALSDRIGRRTVFLTGAALEGLWAFPFFMLLNTGSFPLMLAAVAGGLIFNNFMYGPQAALMTELFSTEFRYSGASLGYQIGAIFGGAFAPIISEALYKRFGSSQPISIYMAILCGVAFLSIVILGETYKREHRDAERAAA